MLFGSDRIDTAPLPVLAGVTATGFVIVRFRREIVAWSVDWFPASIGRFVGWGFVVCGGYAWLVIGAISVVLWFLDNV